MAESNGNIQRMINKMAETISNMDMDIKWIKKNVNLYKKAFSCVSYLLQDLNEIYEHPV